MGYRSYIFHGVEMCAVDSLAVMADAGCMPMRFNILVVDEAELDRGVVAPFAVGSIEIARINSYVLALGEHSHESAIDVTAQTYEWGCYTTEAAEKVWDKAFTEESFVLQQLDDFIGIETAFIDKRFRGKGLFAQALQAVAGVIGFGHHSAMIVLANPWHHLPDKDRSWKDPKYKEDMKRLVACYKNVGFRKLRVDGKSTVMALCGRYNNHKWQKLWLKDCTQPIRLKKLAKKQIIVTLEASKAKAGQGGLGKKL